MSLALYQRSLELCIFSKSSCWLFSSVPDLDSVTMSVLRLWSTEVCSLWFMSVSKRRWLISDSRWEAGKPAMAGNDTSWTVSRNCLFEVFCWAFLCVVSWQMERGIQRPVLKQALQTAGTLQPFVSTVVWTNWINLSPTKWELYYSHKSSLNAKEHNSVQLTSHSIYTNH